MRRVALLILATLLAIVGVEWHRIAWVAGLVPARGVHDTVVFVVMDTVRADRTSICGYSRDTTPTLKKLVKGGATFTCNAYAPGTWTVPSHASFFTGLSVTEHGAHELPTKAVDSAPATEVPCNPLGPEHRTLAEEMQAQGYRTVLVSQNPVVSEPIGLTRGFDRARTSARWHSWQGDDWGEVVEQEVRRGTPGDGEKLFVFLNIAEAHGPWWPQKAGEPFKGRQLFYNPHAPTNVWRRWYDGKMKEKERSYTLGRLDVAYDLGVWRADQALRIALERLERLGVCGDDCRIVITADHGEMLGEHDTIDHGFVPWEGNQRVPLIVAGPHPPRVPERLSATETFDLVRTGAFPAERMQMDAVFWPHAERWEHSSHKAYGTRGAMYWEGTIKWVWLDGTWVHYDLSTDPNELNPMGGVAPAAAQALAQQVESVPDAIGTDARVNEMLQAAGYVD